MLDRPSFTSEKRAAQAIRLLSLSIRNFGPAGRMHVDNSTRFYDEREAAFRQFRTFFRQYACDEHQKLEHEKKKRVRHVERSLAHPGRPARLSLPRGTGLDCSNNGDGA